MLTFDLPLRTRLPAEARASLSHEEAFYSNTNSTAGLPGATEVTSETANLDQWCVLVAVLTGYLKTNHLLQMRQRFMAPPGTRTLTVAGHRPRLQEGWRAGHKQSSWLIFPSFRYGAAWKSVFNC